MGSKMIYLDNAATTKPNEAALAYAVRTATEQFYNPSALYGGGISISSKIKQVREKILERIASLNEFELYFTSGGTESDNQAIFCGGRRGNVVTTAGEHAAIYQSCMELKNRGIDPRFVPIQRDGAVDFEALLSMVDEKTSLVSVVHVNNETGAINDIFEIARAVKKKNPKCLFHSDGVQAFGKFSFHLTRDIDLYSISAHKIGGIKGTGALVKRKAIPFSPLLYGGGQEGNIRSGTENVLGILCFGSAAEQKFGELERDAERLLNYRERLWNKLDREIFTRISSEKGTPYILTISARGLRGEIMQRILEGKGILVGTGSACSSKKPHSRVIEACGVEKELSDGILRISFSPETTLEEVEIAAEALNASARELINRVQTWRK